MNPSEDVIINIVLSLWIYYLFYVVALNIDENVSNREDLISINMFLFCMRLCFVSTKRWNGTPVFHFAQVF